MKYSYADAKKQFAAAKAWSDKNPARNVPVGQAAIPGTAAYKGLQDLFRQMDAQDQGSEKGNTRSLRKK